MKTVFIGPMGNGKIPSNGASVKNHHIYTILKNHSQQLTGIDTEDWGKRPLMLIKLLFIILTNQKSRYILSLNSESAYKLINVLNCLAPKAKKTYWVIGGLFDKLIEESKLKKEPYYKLDQIIVEGQSMKDNLNSMGFENIRVLPNFKQRIQLPEYNRNFKTPIKFVFLSRIIPEKGCELIIKAAKNLYQNGYSGKFSIDFYGPIDDSYKKRFLDSISKFDYIEYQGFLNLNNPLNYETLQKHDVLIFPTYWKGEGCPGVIIDAYFSGLPVLASDWNLNKDYVENNVTGYIFNPMSVIDLQEAMAKCIDHPDSLIALSNNATLKGMEFDINRVLSYENLKHLDLIDKKKN